MGRSGIDALLFCPFWFLDGGGGCIGPGCNLNGMAGDTVNVANVVLPAGPQGTACVDVEKARDQFSGFTFSGVTFALA